MNPRDIGGDIVPFNPQTLPPGPPRRGGGPPAAPSFGMDSMPERSHGAAHWMQPSLAQSIGLYAGRGVAFARGQNGLLSYDRGRHSLVVAPSRSGKGVSFVVPNLLLWEGSAFAIDPKGELAHLTAAHRRRMGQSVHVLDPCRISGQKASRFNPLDWLLKSHTYDTDLKRIVQALTPDRQGVAAFWNEAPRALLVGLITYQIAVLNERKSLGRTWDLLTLDEHDWKDLLEEMAWCDGGSMELNAVVREKARWFKSLHEEHQQYHRGTLQWHLDWLAVKEAKEAVERSDFDIREIKEGRATVYVCIPPTDNETYEGFSRLLATLAIRAMYSRQIAPGSREHPVLLMLDEFATSIGRLKVFEEAYTNIAGYGGRFVTVLQTIDQLQSLYPAGKGTQSWKTVYENAGLRLFFNAEGETARFVSEMLGKKTDYAPSPIGQSNLISTPLLHPEEVSFPRDGHGRHVPEAVFAFVEGFPPIRARRLSYFQDEEFTGKFPASPIPAQIINSGQTLYEKALQGGKAGVGDTLGGSHLVRERGKRKEEPPKVSEEDRKKYAQQDGWA